MREIVHIQAGQVNLLYAQISEETVPKKFKIFQLLLTEFYLSCSVATKLERSSGRSCVVSTSFHQEDWSDSQRRNQWKIEPK